MKNAIGTLIGISLNLLIASGSIVILAIRGSNVSNTIRCSNVLYPSISLCRLQFLSSLSYSFLTTGLTFLDRFFPRYFILVDAVVNGIISLISFLDSLILIHRNASGFCI